MTHTVPLLHDPVVRSILRSIEDGHVPVNLVELLAPEGSIHPETAALLHRLLALPDAYERDVLTLASMLPSHPARHTVLDRLMLALHRTANATDQGYLLACLSRLEQDPETARHIEDLADQLGGREELNITCPTCQATHIPGPANAPHQLADVADATGCTTWVGLIGRLAATRCSCQHGFLLP